MKTYVNELKKLSSLKLKAFNEKLIPSTKYEILGIATPTLRSVAKEVGFNKDFLSALPHTYHEENMLHALILSSVKLDEQTLISELNRFLPFVDNWAVCDSLLRPTNRFFKQRSTLLDYAIKLVGRCETYHIRFGLGLFLSFGLKEEDITKYLNYTLAINNQDYYVEMMLAWFYATALIDHQSDIIKLLEEHKLSPFVHNKTISKAIESYRISSELKRQLKNLKI